MLDAHFLSAVADLLVGSVVKRTEFMRQKQQLVERRIHAVMRIDCVTYRNKTKIDSDLNEHQSASCCQFKLSALAAYVEDRPDTPSLRDQDAPSHIFTHVMCTSAMPKHSIRI